MSRGRGRRGPPDDGCRHRRTGPRGSTASSTGLGRAGSTSGSAIAAKRLLPYRLFERAAKGSLGV